MRNRRRKIWIDPLQTQLLWRLTLYTFSLTAMVFVCFILGRGFFNLYEMTTGSGLAVLASPVVVFFLLVAAICVYDLISFTHRFAGPIYRFRQTIKSISRNEPVALVRLRQGDMMMDMQDDLNEMLLALEQRGLVVLEQKLVAKEDEAQKAPQPAV